MLLADRILLQSKRAFSVHIRKPVETLNSERHQLTRRHAWSELFHRQAVDLGKARIEDDELFVGIKHAKALRHVCQRGAKFRLGVGKRQLHPFALGDVLIDAVSPDRSTVLVLDDENAHRDVAERSVSVDHAMLELLAEVGIGCLDCCLHLDANDRGIVRMHEPPRVFGGRHRVTADRLGRRVKYLIEIVVEGEAVAQDIVFPVARARHLERVGELRLVDAKNFVLRRQTALGALQLAERPIEHSQRKRSQREIHAESEQRAQDGGEPGPVRASSENWPPRRYSRAWRR